MLSESSHDLHSQPDHWAGRFDSFMNAMPSDDGSHDIAHLRRVWRTARSIAQSAGGDQLVIAAACYFHDLINLPKNHIDRHLASAYSGSKAISIIQDNFPEFPVAKYEAVRHAIEAHSFSAQIEPLTLEAEIVQDADRLEAVGAIGIARVFYVAGSLGQLIFDPNDPLAQRRPLNDKQYALDHFQTKLLAIRHSMRTAEGYRIAQLNSDYLIQFAAKLLGETQGEMLELDAKTITYLNRK